MSRLHAEAGDEEDERSEDDAEEETKAGEERSEGGDQARNNGSNNANDQDEELADDDNESVEDVDKDRLKTAGSDENLDAGEDLGDDANDKLEDDVDLSSNDSEGASTGALGDDDLDDGNTRLEVGHTLSGTLSLGDGTSLVLDNEGVDVAALGLDAGVASGEGGDQLLGVADGALVKVRGLLDLNPGRSNLDALNKLDSVGNAVGIADLDVRLSDGGSKGRHGQSKDGEESSLHCDRYWFEV